MPIFLSKDMAAWIWLEADTGIPEEVRPAFEVRALDQLEVERLEVAMANPPKTETYAQARERFASLWGSMLKSVRNVGDLSPLEVTARLTDGELEELLSSAYRLNRVGYQLLKKSKSPQASKADSSAANAGESAKTQPPTP